MCVEILQVTSVRMANVIKLTLISAGQDVKVEGDEHHWGCRLASCYWQAHGVLKELVTTILSSSPMAGAQLRKLK